MSNVKCLNPWDPQSKRQYQTDGVYRTLDAGNGAGGQAHGICYVIEGNVVDRASSKNGKGWCEDVSPTLNTQDRHAIVIAVDQQGGKGNCNYMEDIMPTLLSDSHGTPHAVCYSVDCRNLETNRELSATLQTKETGGWSLNYLNPVMYENGKRND